MTILTVLIFLGLILAIALLFEISNKPQQLIVQPIFANPIQPQKIEPIVFEKEETNEKRKPIGFNPKE